MSKKLEKVEMIGCSIGSIKPATHSNHKIYTKVLLDFLNVIILIIYHKFYNIDNAIVNNLLVLFVDENSFNFFYSMICNIHN